MANILFVDDMKTPMFFGLTNAVKWVKNGSAAVREWKNGQYDTLYLDHDLGGRPNGYDVLLECIKVRVPSRVYFITFNAAGRKRMQQVCDQHNIPHAIALTVEEQRDLKWLQ